MKALLNDDEKSKLPSTIITFNADSLLHSLIVLFNIKKHFDKSGVYRQPKELFRKVTRTFQNWADCIPIFHLHGSISPTIELQNRDSRDMGVKIGLIENYSKVEDTFKKIM